MKTKICKKCHKEKDFSSFYKRKISKDGYRHVCKDCQKEYDKNRFLEKREIIIENGQKYREKNKDKMKIYDKEYYENNKERIKARKQIMYKINKDSINKKNKIWIQNNKVKIRKIKREYDKNKRKYDEVYKITCNVRRLIRGSLKRLGYSKNSKTYKILGCSFEELQNYLFEKAKIRYPDFERKDFLENNKYHIDHIVPLSIAKNEEEVIRLCNYTNLQLLTAQDNLKKSNKIGEF